MLAVAALGLIVNIASLRVLSRGDRENLNLRAPSSTSPATCSAPPARSSPPSSSWHRLDPHRPHPLGPRLGPDPALGLAGGARQRATSCSRARPRASTPPRSAPTWSRRVPEVAAVRHLHAWSITENRPMVTLEAVLPPGADADAARRGSRRALPRLRLRPRHRRDLAEEVGDGQLPARRRSLSRRLRRGQAPYPCRSRSPRPCRPTTCCVARASW